jgi:hypothetical protein
MAMLTKAEYERLLDGIRAGEWRQAPAGYPAFVVSVDRPTEMAWVMAPAVSGEPVAVRLAALATWRLMEGPPKRAMRAWCRGQTTTGLPCTRSVIADGLCSVHLERARGDVGDGERTKRTRRRGGRAVSLYPLANTGAGQPDS